jgi:AraC-like DNA-binding protein
MDYQVYQPCSELQDFVRCYWSLEDEATDTPARQRIIPDGCMEMIFHYGDAYLQFTDPDSYIIQPKAFVFGQISNYLEIAPSGRSGIFAVRFHPDGLLPLINLPASSLQDRATSLQDIFGDDGVRLTENVIDAVDAAARIVLVEKFLLSRFRSAEARNAATRMCIDAMINSNGNASVGDIAGQLQLNRRSLERRFNAAVGLSPKQLSRVIRLQVAMRLMQQKNFDNLTSLAYESGYYDQAHFIKDFKEFAGVSPKFFFSRNLQYSSLFAAAD